MPAPAPIDDPFALLGLPQRFDLARPALEAAYLARSAALHPDRLAAAADPLALAEAAQQSARLNRARDILASDEQRADALLLLRSGPRKEDDKSLPEGFLIDILEIRQEMEEALATGNADDRARLQAWAAEERQVYVNRVAKMFEEGGGGRGGEGNGQWAMGNGGRAIRRQLNAWRYIERMIEQLDPDYRAAP